MEGTHARAHEARVSFALPAIGAAMGDISAAAQPAYSVAAIGAAMDDDPPPLVPQPPREPPPQRLLDEAADEAADEDELPEPPKHVLATTAKCMPAEPPQSLLVAPSVQQLLAKMPSAHMPLPPPQMAAYPAPQSAQRAESSDSRVPPPQSLLHAAPSVQWAHSSDSRAPPPPQSLLQAAPVSERTSHGRFTGAMLPRILAAMGSSPEPPPKKARGEWKWPDRPFAPAEDPIMTASTAASTPGDDPILTASTPASTQASTPGLPDGFEYTSVISVTDSPDASAVAQQAAAAAAEQTTKKHWDAENATQQAAAAAAEQAAKEAAEQAAALKTAKEAADQAAATVLAQAAEQTMKAEAAEQAAAAAAQQSAAAEQTAKQAAAAAAEQRAAAQQSQDAATAAAAEQRAGAQQSQNAATAAAQRAAAQQRAKDRAADAALIEQAAAADAAAREAEAARVQARTERAQERIHSDEVHTQVLKMMAASAHVWTMGWDLIAKGKVRQSCGGFTPTEDIDAALVALRREVARSLDNQDVACTQHARCTSAPSPFSATEHPIQSQLPMGQPSPRVETNTYQPTMPASWLQPTPRSPPPHSQLMNPYDGDTTIPGSPDALHARGHATDTLQCTWPYPSGLSGTSGASGGASGTSGASGAYQIPSTALEAAAAGYQTSAWQHAAGYHRPLFSAPTAICIT